MEFVGVPIYLDYSLSKIMTDLQGMFIKFILLEKIKILIILINVFIKWTQKLLDLNIGHSITILFANIRRI